MHQLGCCTWIFGNEPLSRIAERISRIELDGVELHGDTNGIDPKEAGQIFADHGLTVFSITPQDTDISHPDRDIRNTAVNYYKRLVDWACSLGQPAGFPRIGCHGLVQRIRPVSTQAEEDDLLAVSTRRICMAADRAGLSVVFEVLNRYESHQVRTISEGLALIDRVGVRNLSLLPDSYHMNIEEADPSVSLVRGAGRIGLYHAADSNRGAVGDGHIDFTGQIAALDQIGYDGPIIFEPSVPGSDPFSTDKGPGFQDKLEEILSRSATAIRALGS
ncbi:MAG: sugar phosphate isomerase/epimerase family protein [Paracoccus sp. (in: a-proteobacteria)]